MTPFDIGLIMTGVLLLLVIIGVRVAFAAAFVGIVGMIAIFSMRLGFERGVMTAAKMAGTIPHSKSVTYALSVLPTFILIGFLAYYAGLTKHLFEASKRWLGWLPGGMAIGTVFATAGFAAVSGASTATSAVFARVAIPEMLAAGYSKRLSAAVVAADELESGNRALLNLGHTFGHSLEGAVAYETERLVHGEGVSIGMVLAHEFSEQLGLCPAEDTKRVIAHMEAVGLPTRIDQIPGQLPPIDTFMDLIAQDKKVSRGQLTFILTKGIGTSYVDKTVSAEPLRAFLEEKLGK